MKKFVAILFTVALMAGAVLALAEEMPGNAQMAPAMGMQDNGPARPAMDRKGNGNMAPARKMETRGEWQEKRLEKLSVDLKLTEDQKAKIAAIFREDEVKMKAVTQKMMADLKAIRAVSDQKVNLVLTPEQAKLYEQLKQEQQKKREEMREKKPQK